MHSFDIEKEGEGKRIRKAGSISWHFEKSDAPLEMPWASISGIGGLFIFRGRGHIDGDQLGPGGKFAVCWRRFLFC